MSVYIPLVSALIGAIIGAAASVITVLVQANAQNKRERRKDAVQLALEDWKIRVSLVARDGGTVPPLSAFVHYHGRIVELAENDQLTADALRALDEEQIEIIKTIHEVNRAKRGAGA